MREFVAAVMAACVVACGGVGDRGAGVEPDAGPSIVEVDPVSVLLAGPPSDKRCIIITGQSNAVGQGYVPELTGGDVALASEYAPVLQADRLAQGATFPPTWNEYDLQKLKTRNYQSIERFGIERTMMPDIVAARPHTRWSVIKGAVGGTTLNDQWKPSLATFFPEVHDWIDARIAQLGCTPAAYVWIQGENDAMQTTRAANYQTNLGLLTAAIRARYPSIPFIFGQLHVDSSPTFTSTVRAKQQAYAASDANSYLVSQDSGTLRGDGLHYTTASVIALGHTYATQVLAVVPP